MNTNNKKPPIVHAKLFGEVASAIRVEQNRTGIRSINNMIEILVREALQARGQVPTTSPREKVPA